MRSCTNLTWVSVNARRGLGPNKGVATPGHPERGPLTGAWQQPRLFGHFRVSQGETSQRALPCSRDQPLASLTLQ